MLRSLAIGWCLMAFCVVIHAGGVTVSMKWLRRLPSTQVTSFLAMTWLFIRVAGWMILLHLVELTVWAAAYRLGDAMPDLPSAFYFSAVTYTTTGYGDLVLPQDWRLVGGIEALTGILMCGWSTGFFFAVVSRMFRTGPGELKGH
jgi:hypothetical protein